MTTLKNQARRLASDALNTYFGAQVVSPVRFDENAPSEDPTQLTDQQINNGVVLFVLFNNLPGGSFGEVDLYRLLQRYVRNPEARNRINALLSEYP